MKKAMIPILSAVAFVVLWNVFNWSIKDLVSSEEFRSYVAAIISMLSVLASAMTLGAL